MPEIAEFEIIGKTDQAVKNVGKLNDEIKKTKKITIDINNAKLFS